MLHYCTQSTAQKIYVFHSDIFIERAELLFKTQEYLRNELHSKAGKMFHSAKLVFGFATSLICLRTLWKADLIVVQSEDRA